MQIISRKSMVSRADDRVLTYSALFLVCAAISALGAGALAVMAFLPAVLMVELATHFAKNHVLRSGGRGHA
jgi:hypothetical protein